MHTKTLKMNVLFAINHNINYLCADIYTRFSFHFSTNPKLLVIYYTNEQPLYLLYLAKVIVL